MSSHEERHAPRTAAKGDTEAIPTVSATGMPRIIPRHKDERTASEQEQIDEKEGSAPSELHATAHHHSDVDDSDDDDVHSEEDEDEEEEPSNSTYPPTGSLTLAAFNPYSAIPLSRRLALISGSILINLGLPFLNGVMLGFGEIFARVVVAPALGITGVGWAGDTARAVANWNNWGKARSSSSSSSSSSTVHRHQQQQAGDFDDWSAANDGCSPPHIEL
ncbi:related to MIM1-mitochondrial protein required for outer membrane protein import [Sporisorium reilianum f. sp. reilianum]|uniref:Related to MIM1-mitochondrial protein required for outer membrane protein import n=1 Tax=Sporisorium reilianum f. sp. reilianum TaxID=72559 RepID=A0A2N8UHS4_9BASI|nr:related to MIM1-mitochondrial protein required for outer membrane protein import [Sporisorium reilianum f. sp. reilianum]